MMRTAKRRQRAARPQQLQRAQMNLLVPAQRVRHRVAIARERRRVQHDEIKPRHHLLVRRGDRLRLQPVEDVHGFKRAAFRQPVGGGVLRGGGDRVRALVQPQHPLGPGPRRVQRKSAEKTEAIQHLPRLRHLHQFGHAPVIFLLVQIQTRLVPRREVQREFQAVQLHPDRPRRCAHDRPLRLGQPLESPRGHVVPLQNRPRRKQLLQHREDHPLPLIHPERRRLQHQHVLVFVHDQTAEQIPLRIHHAKRGRPRQVPRPHRQRRADAFREKLLVHLHPVRRDDPHRDLGFRVVEAHPQKPLPMILHLHDRPVRHRRRDPQNRSFVQPRMPCDQPIRLPGPHQNRR